MGLPEVVGAPAVPTSSRAFFPSPGTAYTDKLSFRRDFVLLASAAYNDIERSDALGNQYILGIFPLTRVFLEHGPQSFVTEVLIQTLLDSGQRVLEIPADRIGKVDVYPPPITVIEPLFTDVSVNAYDAFFFRIADVSATLELRFLSPQNFKTVRTERAELEESDYRRQAQAPILSSMLQRNIRNASETMLQKIPSQRTTRFVSRFSPPTPIETRALWLMSPSFGKPPAPGFGQYLSASYGFESVPALSPAAILRVVQRGMAFGLYSDQEPVVSLIDGGEDLSPERALRTTVTRLEVGESGQISLGLRIVEEENGMSIREKTCLARIDELNGVDGAAIMTLERAAALVAQRFLHIDAEGAREKNVMELECSET